MTVTEFRRPPRAAQPDAPAGDVEVPAPPDLPDPAGGASWLTALPALSGVGSVAYMFAGPARPITYLAGSLFLLTSLATAIGGMLRGRSTGRDDGNRRRAQYLRRLGELRTDVRATARAQRALALWRGPAPDQLWTVISGDRLWERRHGDPDFAAVRVGSGVQPLCTPLVADEPGPAEQLDLVASAAQRRFLATHGVLPDTALLLDLPALAAVAVAGPRDDARALCRALLLQAAAFHAPDDLRIAVCTPDPDGEAWSWVKWLPHAQSPDERDELGAARLVVESPAHLGALLEGRPRFEPGAPASTPHVLVVLDGVADVVGEDRLSGVTVLDLDGTTSRCHGHAVQLRIDGGRLSRADVADVGIPDAAAVPLAEALARQLAAVRLDTDPATEGRRTGDTLPQLLGITDPTRPDLTRLRRRAPHDRLRTPIGPAADGAVLDLDIKEAAQGGMGPHGLIIGATGSGKSELLRTLVLGMAATHDSDTLNLVLVDFKGGATFAGLASLPHVSAVITNLEDDLALVDRMREALSGELRRRQQLLRDAGNAVSVRDYEDLRARDAALAPLPTLWVVVDEFSELLAHKPDLAELFAQLGRLGRSLGVHLLLASQRIDEGRLRDLEPHLSYRIALRTFSESESRAVLGVPDAYTLPNSPGHGYLKTDTAELRRFRAAYCSDAVSVAGRTTAPLSAEDVRPFTASRQPLATPEVGDEPRRPVLDVLVDGLAGHGSPAHQMWLPPLGEPDTLDALLPDLRVRPGRGFGATATLPDLCVPVGTVDLPSLQRLDPLLVDLAGAGGNCAVVGGPRSGKSTLLRSLICALALRHTPDEVQFHCLDLGGGALFGLAGLPHVGTVAGRRDVDVARRVVAEAEMLVDAREARFRALGIDGMTAFRRSGDPCADVVIVVDGWAVLRQEFEDLEERLTVLAGRALPYGVHLVLTAGRWLDLRMGLRDLVGGKLELKLGDALDSEIDRRAQQAVPDARPGRGITAERQQYLAALPRVDGERSADELGIGVADLVQRVAAAWTGPVAQPVRLLPTRVTASELDVHGSGLVLGVEGSRLETVTLDPRHEQGVVLFGDPGSGKTSLLRSIARQVLARPPAQAKIVLVDPRRTLLGEFDGAGVLAYAADDQQTRDAVAGVVDGLRRRLPGADVTPQQLRERSWWTGPDVYLLVDDHDLLTVGRNPLEPLVEFLPHARDVGLHVLLTRRAGGAGRALLDPVLGSLRELGQPTVVLSAPIEEATVLGVRTGPQLPGRGTLISHRSGAVPVQLALADVETVWTADVLSTGAQNPAWLCAPDG